MHPYQKTTEDRRRGREREVAATAAGDDDTVIEAIAYQQAATEAAIEVLTRQLRELDSEAPDAERALLVQAREVERARLESLDRHRKIAEERRRSGTARPVRKVG